MTRHQGSGTANTTGTAVAGGGGPGATGVANTTYNVISVIYHALQGADTIGKYLQDTRGNDTEVEDFLREAQAQNRQIAQQGQECLRALMAQEGARSGQQLQGGASPQMGGARPPEDTRQPR